ncbi:MAG: protein kinase [Verrucomicrobia bacterium]|nr:protein kinase [Verrucomicrobiota bacterium]
MEESFYHQPTLTDFTSPKERAGPIPSHIGPYRIETLLSKGGMSLLYLGIHPQTRLALAIKVLSPEFVTHPEMIKRFLNEAKIISLASHPNIVKLYGQGEWEGGLYIAMELIRGVSLRQFIIQQSLSLKRSIDIILQVGYALSHLHSHGVIHGDLKPENILITEDGVVKVIDFGIARLHEEVKKVPTRTEKVIGTPVYMSPEQKEDPSKMTFASDIYALGVIAYELAMGKLSYGVIHLSLLPKGLRKIIEKALAVSPQERYPDAISFITDLSQYLKSGGIERDRPGSDQWKELFETLQSTVQSLSPSSLPTWPGVEMGLAKYRVLGQLGSYYDYFRFPDSYALLLAECHLAGVESSIYVGVLNGLVRALIDPDPRWLTLLIQKVREELPSIHFTFSYLLLRPRMDQLTYYSCGGSTLLNFPQGSETARRLLRQNPVLGEEGPTELLSISDNWNPGDLLVFHNFESSYEDTLINGVQNNRLLSPSSQAEALLKSASTQGGFATQKNPKSIFAIHRIA